MFNKQQMMDSDDEEVFIDVDDGEAGSKKKKKKQREQELKDKLKKINEANVHSESEDEKDPDKPFTNEYDPFKIEPKFANADKSMLWELHLLKSHYHPSIKMFANNILNDEPITYTSDPLQDFSMGNFLDRIILKPAKSADKLKKMKNKRDMSGLEAYTKGESVFDGEIDANTTNVKSLQDHIKSNLKHNDDYLYTKFNFAHSLIRNEKLKNKPKEKEDEEVDPEEKFIQELDDEVEDIEMSDDGEGDFLEGLKGKILCKTKVLIDIDAEEGEGDLEQGESDLEDGEGDDGDNALGEGEDENIDLGDDNDDSMADFDDAPDSD